MKKYNILKGTDADPFPKAHYRLTERMEEHLEETRQKSLYNDEDRARIDNNQFFEERSNPLSSKGN